MLSRVCQKLPVMNHWRIRSRRYRPPSTLTDWHGLERDDGQAWDTNTSDGYGTGFVIVVSRELGLAADDPRLQRGIAWLRTHQRVSGKWFTRSPVNDAGNLISNAGSAFAILALQACGELPGWRLRQ